jgi:hypothetical protein
MGPVALGLLVLSLTLAVLHVTETVDLTPLALDWLGFLDGSTTIY